MVFTRVVREQRFKPWQLTRLMREPTVRLLGRRSTGREPLFSVLRAVLYRRVQRVVALHSSRTVPVCSCEDLTELSGCAILPAPFRTLLPPLVLSTAECARWLCARSNCPNRSDRRRKLVQTSGCNLKLHICREQLADALKQCSRQRPVKHFVHDLCR